MYINHSYGNSFLKMECGYCDQDQPHLLVTCQVCNQQFCNTNEKQSSLSHILKHLKEFQHNSFSVPDKGLLLCQICQKTNILDLFLDPQQNIFCLAHKNDGCVKIVQGKKLTQFVGQKPTFQQVSADMPIQMQQQQEIPNKAPAVKEVKTQVQNEEKQLKADIASIEDQIRQNEADQNACKFEYDAAGNALSQNTVRVKLSTLKQSHLQLLEQLKNNHPFHIFITQNCTFNEVVLPTAKQQKKIDKQVVQSSSQVIDLIEQEKSIQQTQIKVPRNKHNKAVSDEQQNKQNEESQVLSIKLSEQDIFLIDSVQKLVTILPFNDDNNTINDQISAKIQTASFEIKNHIQNILNTLKHDNDTEIWNQLKKKTNDFNPNFEVVETVYEDKSLEFAEIISIILNLDLLQETPLKVIPQVGKSQIVNENNSKNQQINQPQPTQKPQTDQVHSHQNSPNPIPTEPDEEKIIDEFSDKILDLIEEFNELILKWKSETLVKKVSKLVKIINGMIQKFKETGFTASQYVQKQILKFEESYKSYSKGNQAKSDPVSSQRQIDGKLQQQTQKGVENLELVDVKSVIDQQGELSLEIGNNDQNKGQALPDINVTSSQQLQDQPLQQSEKEVNNATVAKNNIKNKPPCNRNTQNRKSKSQLASTYKTQKETYSTQDSSSLQFNYPFIYDQKLYQQTQIRNRKLIEIQSLNLGFSEYSITQSLYKHNNNKDYAIADLQAQQFGYFNNNYCNYDNYYNQNNYYDDSDDDSY